MMLQASRQILSTIWTKKDISFLVFILSLALLPLSINFSTFTFILAIGLHLTQVVLKRNRLFATKALKNATLIGLMFFCYVLLNSILQTSLSDTLRSFEKSYLHFALFFLTPMLLRKKQENKLLLYALFTGTIVATLSVLIYAFINQTQFDKHAFLKVFDIHHTYFSMFLLTLINYALFQLVIGKKDNNWLRTAGLVLAIIWSVMVIYLLGSKVSMVILLLLFLIHTLPQLTKKNIIGYGFFLILLLVVFSTFNKKINVSYESALDFRLQIWEVSFETFEQHPFFGNLMQPEKDLLNYGHYMNGKYYFLDSDLNSHNQFLSILMKFGLVGFLLLFLYGVNIFRKVSSNTHKHSIREFFGFLTIVLVVCYIENILDRHHGIVYLTVFYNYYLVEIENAK